MLTVVTFFWRAPTSSYTYEHVNALARNVARHYARPHRFVCVTNERGRFADGVELVPDVADFAYLHSPESLAMPSCYRRLRLWREDAAATFGARIVALDLDWVAVGDLVPLWDRPEDVVTYRDPYRPLQVNGSMVLLRAGVRPDVWRDFDPERSPKLARVANYRGSDQAWLSYCLGTAPRWDTADGVYSYRKDIAKTGELPAGARVVVFHGQPKPWGRIPQQHAWVRDHWGSAAN